MAEMGAIRTLMKWKAFDVIPAEGTITYKELAEKLDAEVSLVSKDLIHLFHKDKVITHKYRPHMLGPRGYRCPHTSRR
jgi:Mn-dependent DtxR family transcriptional regulator